MKEKLLTITKTILFIITLGTVYTVLTKETDNNRKEYISELRSSDMPLNKQFKYVLDKTLPDSLKIKDYIGFNIAVDSFTLGKTSAMKHFLDSNLIDTISQFKYNIVFETLMLKHRRKKQLIEKYELDRMRLATRFPSNLILSENKLNINSNY